MILNELSIINYRNLKETELKFSHKLNCFVGKNGMGKTNILDAIYFLSFCKSSINQLDSQNIYHTADFSIIKGKYTSDTGSDEIIFCGLKRKKKKSFKRNDKEYNKLSNHIGFIPLVMISPSDSDLISGGSDERRKFLDQVISQYDNTYLTYLIRYNKALEQRNILLKREGAIDETLFEVLEETMAETGEQIYKRRSNFIETFIPIFQKYYDLISGGDEKIGITYITQAGQGSLLDIIKNSRNKDLIMGFSMQGIHKDDLFLNLYGYGIKKEGSQGQNKTCLIALKFAQYAFLRKNQHETPLLLLDDIFDKLDKTRVEKIINVVSGDEFGQIFITDTNREHIDQIFQSMNGDYSLFTINEGEIS